MDTFGFENNDIDPAHLLVDADTKVNNTIDNAQASVQTDTEVASISARSSPSSDYVDIFGCQSYNASSAHLLPHSPICASHWFPIVRFVLFTGEQNDALGTDRKWDFLQKCIHGTKPKNKIVEEIDYVGIKHFPTNRIRLQGQANVFDKYPCVIIVPTVRAWREYVER